MGMMMQAAATAPAFQPAYQGNINNTTPAGQFVCPVHGAAGMPHFDSAGNPICPFGDQIMQFHSIGGNIMGSPYNGNTGNAARGIQSLPGTYGTAVPYGSGVSPNRYTLAAGG
ncbi:hypothetical protein. Homology with gene DMR_41230 of RS-1. Named HMP3 in GenBank [Desulfamplus magnetovallimortis]|uniref:Uncharacterized protein n=2 Tax=Desulfamplus magnetovallimortis TaxID=1246637 RepID=L0R3W1_9BACT|nr:hypothetical protein [Desulfamplus magnetovallimortis]AEX00097.1 HMP3 [Desulfamplus magnetovallimortis BW-1]CCO06683.1 hypothetical protein. Homology with gene DMR_41230 of RS-1. Named HMP3 in GenBank [Desulfamplus magnetovallimortis BW-1]SLM32734.1 hypothetical protein. Homology with gene DMR_41230 of RS-1. Named HMP3 in GenBank [Desulfamplus magnetovallimortis]